MKPRRILYVTRVVKGGAAVVVDQLARRLDRDRYEAIVLFDTHQYSPIRKRLSQLDIKTIDLKKCRDQSPSKVPKLQKRRDIGGWIENHLGKWASQGYASLKSFHQFMLKQTPRIRLFVRTIRENEIDLVHTHSYLRNSKPEIIAAWIAGVPCISHNHMYPKLTPFDKIFASLVDSFIYVSRHQADYHVAQGIPRSKTTIIHNAVNMKEFMRSYDTAAVRAELDSKHDERLVGLIGRIDWWKGHEYFLEAIAEVAKQIRGIKGVIIGELANASINRNRQYLNKLESMVKSLGIEDKIMFTGFRSDIPRLIAALDVVVHASSTPEPFGLVVIEGMAAGKPVVATAAGGVPEIIEDGVNGLLIPCKDSKVMASAIIHILSSRDKAKQMGLAARQRVAEQFTIQNQVAAVQTIYDSILALRQHH